MYKSTIIGDEACPSCKSMGRDTHSNHLIIFSDGNKTCNRCGYTEINNRRQEEEDLHWAKYTPEQVKATLPNGSTKERNLSVETVKHFGMRVEYDTATGEVDKVFYPYFNGKELGYKVRKHYEEDDREVKNKPELLGKFKCFRAIGNVKGTLFNQYNVPKGSKRVLITEGEEDAAAAYEMLAKYKPKVLSIPSGATIDKDGKGILDKAIVENLDYLKSMGEIVTCFDNDTAGKAITEALVKLLGTKVKPMSISLKDASEMCMGGKDAEFISAYFAAESFRPPGLLSVADAREDAVKMPEYGRPWPWPSLTKLTYGRRGGEGIYVGAGVKVGKTEWLSQQVDYIIQTEQLPVFLAKFEQSAGQTLKAIAGKRDKKQYHNPEHAQRGLFSQEDLNNAIDSLDGWIYQFNAGYSDAGQGDLWERLKEIIRYVVVEKGVKDVFIDPITQLTDGMSPSDTETYLRKFSNELQALSQDLDFFYYCFCHLKEPTQGTPHEEGGRVKSAQFRGSRAMQEKTKFMLGIERNIVSDDPEDRNVSTFRLLLNSGFGKPGSFKVKYNDVTGSYLEEDTVTF